MNGDVWTAFPLQRLLLQRSLPPGAAHLVLVDNPPQHPDGDFCVTAGGGLRARPAGTRGLTYAGIGVYTAGFFADMAPGKLPLRPLLDAAIAAGRVSGEYFGGAWTDVGTPQRLRELDARLCARSPAERAPTVRDRPRSGLLRYLGWNFGMKPGCIAARMAAFATIGVSP